MDSFDANLLKEHLNRIFASAAFTKSGRLVKLLNYVAWRSFTDKPRQIKAYEIALDVFEKSVNFDPNDPYVRNIAGLVRKALDQYYEQPHPTDSIKLTLPPGNYVVQFSRINAQTCAQDLNGIDYLESDNHVGLQNSKLNAAVLLTNNSALDTIDNIIVQPNRSQYSQVKPKNDTASASKARALVEKPLLAVIPFASSMEIENELLLGEVLAGELIRAFSPISRLDVMSRLSTTKFKSLTQEKTGLHEKLGTDYIIAGNYRLEQDNIILNVELSTQVNGHSSVIWSDTLTDSVDCLLDKENQLLDEIVHQTCTSIERHEIGQTYKQPLNSLSLYRLIISAINHMHSGPDQLFNRSLVLLNTALKLDKNNPTVNALIAHWHVFRINRSKGWQSAKDKSHENSAALHCRHALSVNPSNAIALTVYGFYKTQFDRDLDAGLSYYKAAQKIDPNEPLAHSLEAAIHVYTGDGDKAIISSERAIKLSPFDPQLHMFETCRAAAYHIAGKLEQAEFHARKACMLNSNHTSSIRGLISILVERGNINDAEKHASTLLKLDPGFTTSDYLARAPSAKHSTGRRIAESLRAAGIPVR